MAMQEINGLEEFNANVLNSDVPVVIDMWAAWCMPCRRYSPIIEQLSGEYTQKVKFMKVNVDENYDLATKYNIQSLPTTLLITNGRVKAELIGAVPTQELKKWLETNLK